MDFEKFQQEYNSTVEIMETGDYGDAEEAFHKLLDRKVSTEHTEELKKLRSSIWNNLGAMALEQGDLKKSERALEKTVELNPEHASAYNNLAG